MAVWDVGGARRLEHYWKPPPQVRACRQRKLYRQLPTFVVPAVDAIHSFDISKAIPDLRCRDRGMTIYGTEGSPLVAQFNEFLMSRLHLNTICCSLVRPWSIRLLGQRVVAGCRRLSANFAIDSIKQQQRQLDAVIIDGTSLPSAS